MTKWKPEEAELMHLYEIIERYKSGEAIFSEFNVTEHIDSLVYILTRAEDKALEVRLAAGHLLEKHVTSTSDYMKLELMHASFKASDVPNEISISTVAVIHKILDEIGVSAWPELLKNILDFTTFCENQIERAVSILYKISDCEDGMNLLSSSAEVAFDFLVQYNSLRENNEVEEQFANLLLRLVEVNPTVLANKLSDCLGLLRNFTESASKEVRALVTPCFVVLIQQDVEDLQIKIYSMINRVMTLSRDSEPSVALSACRFWLSYWSVCGKLEHLEHYGRAIFDVLVENLKHKATENSCDELRSCCIDALNIMFIPSLGDFPFNTLMSILQSMLISTQWEDREASCFALGEMAVNIVETNSSMCPTILVSIMSLLMDNQILVRSSACRTLSSFARLLVSTGGEQLHQILECLFQRMSDDDIAVRTSACSAICSFQEILSSDGKDKLTPHIDIFLKYATRAFTEDQSGLTNFCLIISNLLDNIEEIVIENEDFNALLERIMSKWKDLLLDQDQLILCYGIINKVLRGKEPEFLRMVFQNCISTINTKIQSAEYAEVVVHSLELLNVLKLDVLEDFKKLDVDSNLAKLLITCCTHIGSALIRRNAFFLLGRLGKICPDCLESHLEEIYTVGAAQLKLKRMTEDDKLLASYACSAIADLTKKCKVRIYPESVFSLLLSLISIFKEAEERPLTGPGPELSGSSAVAFTRLIRHHPKHVRSLPHFLRLWCMALSRLVDNNLKREAFITLYDIMSSHDALVQSNSVFAIMKFLASLEVLICSQEMSVEQIEQIEGINRSVGRMFCNCKKKGGEVWKQSMSDEELAKLIEYESFYIENMHSIKFS